MDRPDTQRLRLVDAVPLAFPPLTVLLAVELDFDDESANSAEDFQKLKFFLFGFFFWKLVDFVGWILFFEIFAFREK